MSFAFRSGEPFQDGVKRIVRHQLTKAIDALESRNDDGEDLRKVVHGARKRGKRVRAVLRLVRPGLGTDYRSANIAVRDVGRLLAPIRDAHALLGTFDALTSGTDEERAADLFGVRAGLARRARAATAAIAADDAAIVEAAAILGSVRDQIDDWSLDDGFGAIGPGLRATYRYGRQGFRNAVVQPTPEALHEWRKSAKYLWHQAQLLAPAAPSILDSFADALHTLADTLGDDHDLVVLCDLVRTDPDAFGGVEQMEDVVALAGRRRVDLEHRAVVLGARLYAEKPKAFVDRLARYVEVWQTYGDERPAGEIATIAPPEDGLDELSSSRLYGLARAAAVPGRSTMGRDDLLGSLRALPR